MQMEFKGRFATALHHLAFHVDGTNVINSELASLARANVDQHLVVGQANAGMTVVVNDVLRFQHANAIDQFLFQCERVCHGAVNFIKNKPVRIIKEN
jgi:hypothetical protein